VSDVSFLLAARALGVIPECLRGPAEDTRHLDPALMREGYMLAALGDLDNWEPIGTLAGLDSWKAAQ
jgi:hypothetical protein